MRPAAFAVAFSLLLAAAGASAAAPAPADWRTPDPANVLVIDTTKGRIVVEMVPEMAPAHVAQVRALAHQGFYDGLAFFRVLDRFMAQTGDPDDRGDGKSTLPDLKSEFSLRRDMATPFVTVARPMGLQVGFIGTLPVVSQADAFMVVTQDHKAAAWATYCPGVVGMGRDDSPDSANSQFFLMRDAYPSLDKRYTAWGRVLSGLDVVRAIKTGEPVKDPDRMLSVRVLADLPEATRPKVRVIDPGGPAFAALVKKVRAARGADFSVCDIDLPVEVR